MKLVLYEDLFSENSSKDTFIDNESKKIIENILKECIYISPWDLVAKSHVSDGAWSNSISIAERYPITDQDISCEIAKGL